MIGFDCKQLRFQMETTRLIPELSKHLLKESPKKHVKPNIRVHFYHWSMGRLCGGRSHNPAAGEKQTESNEENLK